MIDVAEDLIKIKFKPEDTLADCLEKFYAVLRKYNIKQTTPVFNDEGEQVGNQCNNFDYTMCAALFYDRVKSFFEMELNFGKIPEDIK